MTQEPIPDWQLPPGVDRGLWDYMRSGEMVAGYDEQIATSPLARADVAFCEKAFPTPGRLLDLGCGTGRLCRHFAAKGYDCVGVDLSEEMLERARAHPLPRVGLRSVQFLKANLVDLAELSDASFDYAACLFSTLGMVRDTGARAAAIRNVGRVLKPGGRFVLHVHNRWFRGLGWKRWGRGDITMPQAYGGAPLTLHHFSQSIVCKMLTQAEFKVLDVVPVGIDGEPACWPAMLRAYGYLFLAEVMA